ncbi:hypothetical protein AVEN_217605-1 [Araneus ventricosus]|uniref:Uncharacterized protein n=1 Tax=Araneus ventricosus TaxID=182803 RepID=A0A4Y2FI06_ARAVE|nr:hypothetical protein AVEN_217605-1 [Araneus ventricosus]
MFVSGAWYFQQNGTPLQVIHISSKMEFLNPRTKKHSSVLKTDGNWHSGMAKLKFQRTLKSNTSCTIPVWGLDARVAAHQRICLDWDLGRRLENWKYAVCGEECTLEPP